MAGGGSPNQPRSQSPDAAPRLGELMRKETGRPLPDSLVAQIYQRTGGVPLLVEEFTRIIGESELARDIPSTLQELVLSRLDRMSSNREVAQMAATLGREFHDGILAAVVSTDTQTLLAELEKLVTAEILCVKGQPRNCTFAFKHANPSLTLPVCVVSRA
jgi:predicted ATPase